jgi:tRNA (pseudouridine54-N1)-methyltransferase
VTDPPPRSRRILLVGERLRYLNPDERSTAALLKNALVRSATRDRDLEASPGLVVGPVNPDASLRAFSRSVGAFWLEEGGTPIERHAPDPGGFAALLGDPSDLTEAERSCAAQLGIPRVSLGSLPLRSSQCVDAVHHWYDVRTRGSTTG